MDYLSGDVLIHTVQRQHDSDSDEADNQRHDDDQNRFQHTDQTGGRSIGLLIKIVSGLAQDGIDGTRLLADEDHGDQHRVEDMQVIHGSRDVLAPGYLGDDVVELLLDDGIADDACDHPQHVDDVDAGCVQAGERPGAARGIDRAVQLAEVRQIQLHAVQPVADGGNAVQDGDADDAQADDEQDHDPVVREAFGDIDQNLRRHRQLMPLIEGEERRQHLGHQEQDDDDADDGQDDRIHEGAPDLVLQPVFLLKVLRHLGQIGLQDAAGFPGGDHVDQHLRENVLGVHGL